eukprot:CAMPEP_0114976826 /NCGR_PEP_ID=MMETSP0216-20121206/2891_1 /TAXON_ID=223996 /ORGANISM="Protocruzia adherens, Strain Boccale" /LENGTH=72 /DNA_ID=CAMNT_0002337803 /DNA_START=879 /DNA_END=1095 /DNA_ORIENTATION=-
MTCMNEEIHQIKHKMSVESSPMEATISNLREDLREFKQNSDLQFESDYYNLREDLREFKQNSDLQFEKQESD